MPKRQNKSKKDVVSDIQLSQDAQRRRSLIKDIIFPYLIELNESVGYSKLFIQSSSGLIEKVYEENRKRTTVAHIQEKVLDELNRIFSTSKPEQKKEYDRYVNFLEKLKDISIQDLAYASELPRYMDGYMMSDKAKESITTIPIDKILG